jgi:hypothetical protein
MAPEWPVAAPLLWSSSRGRDDVLALAESAGGRQTLAYDGGNRAEETARTSPPEKQTAVDRQIGKRSKAIQAFRAMHVEALNWSGLSTTHNATSLDISAHACVEGALCSRQRRYRLTGARGFIQAPGGQ